MGAIKKSNEQLLDVMTPERLRTYWFGGPQVPFWNYDPAQLTVGLELEYFIAAVNGDSFQLASKAQYFETIGHLIADAGYVDRHLPDQPGRISKNTSRGFIAIKPDFAWHILEIALPPRRNTTELRSLLEETFAEVDRALKKVGLERLDRSCLPDVPEKLELVGLERLEAHIEALNDNCTSSPFSLAVFPALIAATHVHFNAFRESDLSFLPALYANEEHAMQLFVRVQKFRGASETRHRSKFYENAYGENYKLRTIPSVIPSNIDEYCDQLNSSPRLFPSHPFFAVRDMSYIRPTRHGTFEFRSSCSFRDLDEIIKIVDFRRKQILAAFGSRVRRAPSGGGV